MIYIHEENGFWHRETVLQPSFKIGTTLEDYEDGAYLLLNAEQEQHRECQFFMEKIDKKKWGGG